ncbi:MAG TPA: RNA polymerase sigma factor [Holophagaceae bacterium]|nr:RNA polymerase sigma factor [Holophagaceae bacterium]
MSNETPDVVERLVAEHRRFLAFLIPRTASAAEAEDILQEAYVRSLERGEQLRDDEKLVAWFYRLLRNALVDRARSRAAEGRALEAHAWELPEAELPPELEAHLCQCVKGLLPTLSPDHAEILAKVDLGGATPAEAAQALGITANAASVRLHRARKALHERLVATCGTCTEHGCLDCRCGKPSTGGGCKTSHPHPSSS